MEFMDETYQPPDTRGAGYRILNDEVVAVLRSRPGAWAVVREYKNHANAATCLCRIREQAAALGIEVARDGCFLVARVKEGQR